MSDGRARLTEVAVRFSPSAPTFARAASRAVAAPSGPLLGLSAAFVVTGFLDVVLGRSAAFCGAFGVFAGDAFTLVLGAVSSGATLSVCSFGGSTGPLAMSAPNPLPRPRRFSAM
ncbi:MAG: hypothetical protein ACTH9H_01905 [Galactobacter sp.]